MPGPRGWTTCRRSAARGSGPCRRASPTRSSACTVWKPLNTRLRCSRNARVCWGPAARRSSSCPTARACGRAGVTPSVLAGPIRSASSRPDEAAQFHARTPRRGAVRAPLRATFLDALGGCGPKRMGAKLSSYYAGGVILLEVSKRVPYAPTRPGKPLPERVRQPLKVLEGAPPPRPGGAGASKPQLTTVRDAGTPVGGAEPRCRSSDDVKQRGAGRPCRWCRNGSPTGRALPCFLPGMSATVHGETVCYRGLPLAGVRSLPACERGWHDSARPAANASNLQASKASHFPHSGTGNVDFKGISTMTGTVYRGCSIGRASATSPAI